MHPLRFGDIICVMKTTQRLVLGIVSSLLFAVGFVRAAERFDPISANVVTQADQATTAAADCGGLCDAQLD